MKTTLIKLVMLALSGASALAISLPVAEDTFTTAHRVLTPANGKAATLLLNTNQAALVKFDFASLPEAFTPTNILSARLKIYILTARTPGDLVANSVTSVWTEDPLTNAPMPSVDPTVIGMVPAAKVVGRHFVSIDVTAATVAALNGSGSNFGFLLQDTKGQTSIPSKEGPSLGPCVELEIDANLSLNAAANAAIPGSLIVGGNFDMFGLSRQGTEDGTSQPAGRGIITRRLESTNAVAGSVVARTDTVTLERDGSSGGWRIVNTANPGTITVVATGLDSSASPVSRWFGIPNSSPASTNTLFLSGAVVYFRCSFGDPTAVGHHTEVSLMRDYSNNGDNRIGNMITSYDQ
jgi:hypothetical protein